MNPDIKIENEVNNDIILTYVKETIENHQYDKNIKAWRNISKVVIPKELSDILIEEPRIKNCFEELTTGRQREYVEYIISAKKEVTKRNRIEKIIPLVIDKKGLYDKYKNC